MVGFLSNSNCRSTDENEVGAGTDASSQVSIVVGRGFVGGWGWDWAAAGLNGSMRDGATPSSTQTRWLIGRLLSCCTNPLGQRMDALTGPLACPRPKNTSLLCCERN